MIDDTTLLGRYAAEHSEAAFNDLVTRHLDLVHSAALRLMGGDTHRAQDVTQQVFAELARQAQKLSKHPVLVGWLYTTTRRIALQTSRGEYQRSRREQEAHAMTELLREPHPEKDWDQLSKVVEDAMHDLGEKDRLAVLMRYFQNKPFNEVGAALGVNENAARMRVDRALDKLRGLLASRDVALSATGLGTALAANTVQAAPFGLAAVVSTSALAAGSTILTSTQAIAMTTLQKSLIAATVVASISIAIYHAKLASDLREQVQGLQEQKSLLADQFQQLIRDRATTTGQVATLRDENERLKGNTRELLRLRGEIGLLKGQTDPVIANNGTKGLMEWLEAGPCFASTSVD